MCETEINTYIAQGGGGYRVVVNCLSAINTRHGKNNINKMSTQGRRHYAIRIVYNYVRMITLTESTEKGYTYIVLVMHNYV